MGVTLRRRGDWWHLDIFEGGRRYRRPTHTREKKKAERIRHELQAALLSGEWNVALALETTLARGLERFRAEYEPAHHAPSTRSYTAGVFGRFERFMAGRRPAGVLVDAVGKSDIEAFQLERSREVTVRKRPVAAATVIRDVRELSTFFKWAQSVGICRRNPVRGIRYLRGVRRKVQPLTDEEIRKLLLHLEEPFGDVARLVLNTGLRLGEALHLRREDIDLAGALLVIRSRSEYLVKDREEREIPLVPPALEVCRRRVLAAGPDEPLFRTSQGTVIENRNALRSLYKACGEARIRRASWYLMRHTFASVQARVLTPAELKSVMGHADIRTADKYYVHLQGRYCRIKPVAK